ncbi:hypothetical protein OG225_19790 [Nocardia sp. NBC_01377]|uniref:hypothetical protein n=1 Tax=Nocardia sp. NBC_01377 TaxID=2903595 RepID=UPI00324D926F
MLCLTGQFTTSDRRLPTWALSAKSGTRWISNNAKTIPSDDLNDEDDHEVEDTSTDIDTEIAAALQEKIDRGEY